MSFLQRLLYLLGIAQDPTPHTYNLNSDLHIRIADLAQQEQLSPEEITEQLLNQALNQRYAAAETWQRWLTLTRREQQVAALASLRYTNAEIATHLGVSIDTIRSHIRNILVKFGVTSRKQLEMLLSGWNFGEIIPPNLGGNRD
jgi:DNA-binding CsgD family transcriptional regulator